MTVGIPASWDDVDAAWMSAALGAEVASVELLLRDDGTNRRARFEVSYADGRHGRVFAKAADPEHAELNSRMGGLFNEPRLFASGVSLPVDHPHVFLALVDEAAPDFLLLMEDVLDRGADPRDSTRPLTVAQAANGARALGRLHGAFWGGRLASTAGLGWLEPFVPWEGFARGIPRALEKAGDAVPAEVQALTVERLSDDLWTRYIRSLADGPPTLLHGDPHIGNTYVLPGDDVGFLDWQVARSGGSSLDLGYFLQGAVTVEDRRACERDLLEEYRGALGLPADELPSRDELWLRYRASVVHGLAIWLATFSYDGWQTPEVCLALVERYAQAYVDLDSAEAIDRLR